MSTDTERRVGELPVPGDTLASDQRTRALADGMSLLEEMRPEVVRAQRGLVRELGRSLPPATRQLVLVALATVEGTPRALRRHVTRALASGARPDQVIDSIVLALPQIGVARVAQALKVVAQFIENDGG